MNPLKLRLKFSPETVIMIPLAIGLDAIGYCLIAFGLDDFCLCDIIGMFFFGGWLAAKTGNGGGIKTGAQKIYEKLWPRFFGAAAVELVPYVGSLVPTWVILVISVLNDQTEDRDAAEEGEAEETELPHSEPDIAG
ncbi:MAG: hypothetical protein PHG23_02285 [Candidatus Pacebacteria bacterium]|nr:hypothetical protein [Candidatus Paceibacterota bacterium]